MFNLPCLPGIGYVPKIMVKIPVNLLVVCVFHVFFSTKNNKNQLLTAFCFVLFELAHVQKVFFYVTFLYRKVTKRIGRFNVSLLSLLSHKQRVSATAKPPTL